MKYNFVYIGQQIYLGLFNKFIIILFWIQAETNNCNLWELWSEATKFGLTQQKLLGHRTDIHTYDPSWRASAAAARFKRLCYTDKTNNCPRIFSLSLLKQLKTVWNKNRNFILGS